MKTFSLAVIGILVAVFWMGQCNAGKMGELNQKAATWKAKADSAGKKADSLRKAANTKDAILKAQADSLSKRKVVYRERVDSIRILPAPPESPKGYALVDTAQMHKAFASADSIIALHERKDSVQEARYALLKEAYSWKEQEARALNRRIAVDAKRITRARFQGSLIGVGAAGFALLTVMATQ